MLNANEKMNSETMQTKSFEPTNATDNSLIAPKIA